jgi:hypothetical protein
MDDTRDGHPCVFSQLYPFYARALEVRNLVSIVSAEDLAETDRRFLKFAQEFEKRCVGQGEDGDRAIIGNPRDRLATTVAVAAGDSDARRRGRSRQVSSLGARDGGGVI